MFGKCGYSNCSTTMVGVVYGGGSYSLGITLNILNNSYLKTNLWLVGSTHLKNMSQNRKSSPIEWTWHIWNHHLDPISMVAYPKESPSRQVSRIRQQAFSAVFRHTSPTLALCCTSRWRPWSSASYDFHKPSPSQFKWSRDEDIWVFPKIMGIPKSSILIGFSIIFTIHFGENPIFGNIHI